MSSTGGLDSGAAAAAGGVNKIKTWDPTNKSGSALSRWVGKNRTASGMVIGGIVMAAALIAAPFTFGFSLAALAPAGAAIGGGMVLGGVTGELSKASKGQGKHVRKNMAVAGMGVIAVVAATFFVLSTFGVGAGVLGIGGAIAAKLGWGTGIAAIDTAGFFAACGMFAAAVSGFFSNVFHGSRAESAGKQEVVNNPGAGAGADTGVNADSDAAAADDVDAGAAADDVDAGAAVKLGRAERVRALEDRVPGPPVMVARRPFGEPPADDGAAAGSISPAAGVDATVLREAHAQVERQSTSMDLEDLDTASALRAMGLGHAAPDLGTKRHQPPVEDLTAS